MSLNLEYNNKYKVKIKKVYYLTNDNERPSSFIANKKYDKNVINKIIKEKLHKNLSWYHPLVFITIRAVI